MKVKKIGNITLTNPIWWTNYNDYPVVQAETEMSITGNTIVWEQALQTTSINIELSSKSDGWQTPEVKDALKILVRGSIGTTTTITTVEDVVIHVRFRHEGTPLSSDRIFDTYDSPFYLIVLSLAKV